MLAQKKGFTLVELLIVISIIATLSVVGLVSYTNFTKSSRDAKRQSDLKLIQSALEEYHGDQLFYPGSINFGNRLTNGNKTYLNLVPQGAKGSSIEYVYRAYKWNPGRTTQVLCRDQDNGDSDSANNCIKYCLYSITENLIQRNNNCSDIATHALEVTSP